MSYNWQQQDWPNFAYDLASVEGALFRFAEVSGRVSGLLDGLPASTQQEALIEVMVSEAIKTSEIEGEFLSRQDVMSSIRNNLGLNKPTEAVNDKRAEGAAELMSAVRDHYAAPLSEDMLFSWHEMLMQSNSTLVVGAWRKHKEPMQVVSGPVGKETVHYEAPPSSSVAKEMQQFVLWFNNTNKGGPFEISKPVVRSAIAHLYFESVHPFEDGNGRIGRAVSEKALSQGLACPVFLSLSKSIEANRNAYYAALKTAQRSNEITAWIEYFVGVVLHAQLEAEQGIEFTLKKTKFFDRYNNQLNDRQLKVVGRMLEEGPQGFEGGMSASKYLRIAKTSKATATRDLKDLAEKGALLTFGGGRSTRYEINLN